MILDVDIHNFTHKRVAFYKVIPRTTENLFSKLISYLFIWCASLKNTYF